MIDRLAWSAVLLVCAASAWSAVLLSYRQSRQPNVRLQEPETPSRILAAAGREVAGDAAGAERILLETAARDKRFPPAWALASFYQRQRRTADFWRWARRAIEASYGDRGALFQAIADQGSPEEAAAVIPARLAGEFSAFLLGHGQVNQALAMRPPEDRSLGLLLAERLLLAGRLDGALMLWNQSGPQPISHEKPAIVNGEFRSPPSGTGFDWRLNNGEDPKTGVLHAPGQEGQLEVHFFGYQERLGELATQWVALAPGRRHRLSFEWKSTDLNGDPGLRWNMDLPSRTLNLLRDAPPVPVAGNATGWPSASLAFDVPADVSFARCSLTWATLAGERRVEGAVAFRRVRLELAE